MDTTAIQSAVEADGAWGWRVGGVPRNRLSLANFGRGILTVASLVPGVDTFADPVLCGDSAVNGSAGASAGDCAAAGAPLVGAGWFRIWRSLRRALDSTDEVIDAVDTIADANRLAPRALPAFSRSSVGDAAASASRAYNDQISVGARAIDKRLGKNSVPFQGIDATTANAQALVTDILENPTRTVFGARTYDVYNAAQQGARFDVSTNRFITFLDGTIATR